MKAACDALGRNVEADGMAAWIEVDVVTPAVQHCSEGAVTASVKNGKADDELGAGDTGSDSENNTDDSCEVMVLKLSKVNKILMK
jgi:hypothetical protein